MSFTPKTRRYVVTLQGSNPHGKNKTIRLRTFTQKGKELTENPDFLVLDTVRGVTLPPEPVKCPDGWIAYVPLSYRTVWGTKPQQGFWREVERCRSYYMIEQKYVDTYRDALPGEISKGIQQLERMGVDVDFEGHVEETWYQTRLARATAPFRDRDERRKWAAIKRLRESRKT